jgi:hypothetical protein
LSNEQLLARRIGVERNGQPLGKAAKIADKSVLWKPCSAGSGEIASLEHNRSMHRDNSTDGDHFWRDLARMFAFVKIGRQVAPMVFHINAATGAK